MKKTITVNLGGVVFNIDEDAFQLLENYLSNLREHFKNEEGADEMMGDFEGRISELLSGSIRLGASAITLDHVEEVIKRMGKPEEIFGQDERSAHGSGKTAGPSATAHSHETPKKRLMRDPDNKVLGGVSSGLAHYFGIDITAMRLIMLLLLFFVNAPMVFVYIVLWIAMPLARTAADKLMMRGESVSVENIGKTVTGGFAKDEPSQPRSTIQKTGDFIVSFFSVILKICTVLLGVALVPVFLFVLFVLFVVLFSLLVTGAGSLLGIMTDVNASSIMPELPFSLNMPVGAMIAGGISIILFVGIPLAALCYAVGRSFFHFRPMSSAVKWTLAALWVVSLIACLAILATFGLSACNI